jgi:hypothetical protein
MPNIYMVFSVLALGLSLQTTARAQQYVYPRRASRRSNSSRTSMPAISGR